MRLCSRLVKKTSVNALQTYPYISLMFFNLNLKKKNNCKSWKVPYVIKVSQSLTGHHRICCGVGEGSDLLDTWNTPIKEDYFSKERLCHLFLPWEGCSFLEKFVSFESGLRFFPQMNFIVFSIFQSHGRNLKVWCTFCCINYDKYFSCLNLLTRQ